MLSDWVWMPHAAHLCVAQDCQFRLATYVNGVIVSTVGEWPYRDTDHRRGSGPWQEIGLGRTYETMVFKARPTTPAQCEACPYEADICDGELDMEPYNSAKDAYAGHLALCRKWDERGLSEERAG